MYKILQEEKWSEIKKCDRLRKSEKHEVAISNCQHFNHPSTISFKVEVHTFHVFL